jgi:Plasmid pRiA4b ORF-3-like protein
MSKLRPAHNVIVQIRIELLGLTKAPVWRRVQLRADTRLDQLHEILQATLGWENYHNARVLLRRGRVRDPPP